MRGIVLALVRGLGVALLAAAVADAFTRDWWLAVAGANLMLLGLLSLE